MRFESGIDVLPSPAWTESDSRFVGGDVEVFQSNEIDSHAIFGIACADCSFMTTGFHCKVTVVGDHSFEDCCNIVCIRRFNSTRWDNFSLLGIPEIEVTGLANED